MSLRTRLTLIYGGVLVVVFVALGLGAEAVMQGRFTDQARSSLTAAASYAINHSRCVACGPSNRAIQFALPATQQPFANVYLELVSPNDARVTDRSDNLASGYLHLDPKAVRRAWLKRQTTFLSWTQGGNLFEFYYTPMPNPTIFRVVPSVLVAAKSESDVSRALEVFNAALFSGEAVVWLLAVAITWLVTGSALRPIKAITERAAAIAETSDFSGRVPVDTHTAELQALALTFNRMLDSLSDAYGNQQRFLADASHELRTPLTVVQGNLHYLEEAIDAPESEREEALHAARLEADRMGVLVSDLLSLSQADAGYGIQRQPVELDRIVIDGFRRILARERTARPRRTPQLHLGRLDEAVVEGDPERLLQLVVILLDNAVKYTPPNGTIDVELVLEDGVAMVRVADTGSGIAEEDREHIFERFYRAKESHVKTEGSGLGLAIAKWIAETHSGSIRFETAVGRGTTFVVTLPALAQQSVSGLGLSLGRGPETRSESSSSRDRAGSR